MITLIEEYPSPPGAQFFSPHDTLIYLYPSLSQFCNREPDEHRTSSFFFLDASLRLLVTAKVIPLSALS